MGSCCFLFVLSVTHGNEPAGVIADAIEESLPSFRPDADYFAISVESCLPDKSVEPDEITFIAFRTLMSEFHRARATFFRHFVSEIVEDGFHVPGMRIISQVELKDGRAVKKGDIFLFELLHWSVCDIVFQFQKYRTRSTRVKSLRYCATHLA